MLCYLKTTNLREMTTTKKKKIKPAITAAVIHDKGGSGSSTTVYNMAVAEARKGKKVLIIDNDEQATLMKTFGKRQFTKIETRNIIKRLVADIQASNYSFPPLTPMTKPVLKEAEANEFDLLNVIQLQKDEDLFAKIEETKNEYDYIFIDTRNGIAKDEVAKLIQVCDVSFIPYFTNAADLDTAEHARIMINKMKAKHPGARFNIHSILIVENYSSTNEVNEIAEWFTNNYSETHPLLPSVLVRRNVYRKAFNFGKGVCEMSGYDAYTATQELQEVFDDLIATI